MFLPCNACGAQLDPVADAARIGTYFDGHHYHLGCETDTCPTCGTGVRCTICRQPYVAEGRLNPATHDLYPFDASWYTAWVDQAAAAANQTHWTWSEHTGATSQVAEKYWAILTQNQCQTIDVDTAHYFQEFNGQYAGGRGNLYHA